MALWATGAGCGAARPISYANLQTWGNPTWTLQALAIPPSTRFAAAEALARRSMSPEAKPAQLLDSCHWRRCRPSDHAIAETYAYLAKITPRVDENASSDFGAIAPALLSTFKQAAALTGASPTYLTKVAWAESSYRPYASAPTSSARGLFQFIDESWLAALKRYGGQLGLRKTAATIRLGAGGRAEVANATQRRILLDLRHDPQISSVIAGAVTRENARLLASALGRAPTDVELYAAHVFGPQAALQLIAAKAVQPSLSAALVLHEAAHQNPWLFYEHGQALSVEGLLNSLRRKVV
jgi:hypothetical protein